MDLMSIVTVPKMAVVNRMEINIGEKKLQGIIKEKVQANEEFNQGIQEGKTMAICQNHTSPDLLELKLGNLAPTE